MYVKKYRKPPTAAAMLATDGERRTSIVKSICMNVSKGRLLHPPEKEEPLWSEPLDPSLNQLLTLEHRPQCWGTPGSACSTLCCRGTCALGNLPTVERVCLIPGPHTDFSSPLLRLHFQLPGRHTPDMTHTEPPTSYFSPGLDPLIHSFIPHSLSAHSVPDPVPGTWETAANKQSPPPQVYNPVGTQIVNE